MSFSNTCSLIGVDEAILKQRFILTSTVAYTIISMNYSVSHIIRVTVKAENPVVLHKLVSVLLKMSKVVQLVRVINTKLKYYLWM